MKNNTVVLNISEYDIELLKDLVYSNKEDIEWTIVSESGENIDIIFTKEEQLDE